MSRKAFLPIVLAATLAACKAQTPPPAPTPPPVAEAEAGCGAGKVAGFIGRKATEDVITAIRETSGAATLRVLEPDMAVTMDYRADRLNVDLDENGVIKALRCT
jgi:hypothetical protein